MPEAITAEYFIERGVPAAAAEQYAREHNQLTGIRPATAESAPTPQGFERLPAPTPNAPPLTQSDAERAHARMAEIRRDRASGKIGDYEWRTKAEAEYLHLAGVDQAIRTYESAT